MIDNLSFLILPKKYSLPITHWMQERFHKKENWIYILSLLKPALQDIDKALTTWFKVVTIVCWGYRAIKFPTQYTEMISNMFHGVRLALLIQNSFCFQFWTLQTMPVNFDPPNSQGSSLMEKNLKYCLNKTKVTCADLLKFDCD